MTPVLITGVRLYGDGDPVDVLVADGQIAEIGTGLKAPKGAEVIDASGQVLLPGLVDLHTHLREPGREYAEDIETGSAAAALGGFTAVFAMANTDPVADSPVVTDHVWRRGQQVGLVDVHPVGAVTVGHQAHLGELFALQTHGDGADGVHIDQSDLLPAPPHVVGNHRAVGHRVGVGHREDSGIATESRCSRAGFDVLGVFAARLT